MNDPVEHDTAPVEQTEPAVPSEPAQYVPPVAVTVQQTPGEFLANRSLRLSDYHVQIADRFKEWLRVENKPSTADEYTRQMRLFLAWVEVTEQDLRTLPPAAVESYFEYRGFRPGNAVRNMTNCAVRAFMRWALIAGLSIPPLDIPASVRPPRKKTFMTTPTNTVALPPVPEAAPTEAAPPSASVGAPPAVDSTSVPTPPSNPAVGGAPPSSPAPQVVAPTTYAPPQPGAPFVPAPGVRTRALSQPRATDKRQQQGRDPLGALLPDGGCLQIKRVSDGSDGQSVGRRVPIGEYREEDIRGYQRIEEWLREVVHPQLDPLRSPTVTYIVEQYDSYGRFLPPARQVPLQNSGAASSSSYVPGGQGGSLDRIITSFVSRLESQQKKMEEEHVRWSKTMEELKRPGGNVDGAMLAWMLGQKPPVFDAKSLMGEFIMQVEKIVGSNSKDPSTTVVGPPASAPTDNVHRDLIDLVKTQLDKAETKAAAPKPADPVDMAIRMAEAFKAPAPAPDPRVSILEQTVQELKHMNTELLRRLDTAKPVSFEDKLRELSALDGFLERRTGGVGGIEALGLLAEKLPETIQALAGLRSGQQVALPPAANQPVKTAGTPAQQAPAQKPVVPAAVVDALKVITESQTDADVLNRTQALLVTLSQSPAPWNGVVENLVVEMKDIQTVEELQSTITKLYRVLGGRELLVAMPGIAAALAQSIGRHFDSVICPNLGIPPRRLIGIPAAEPAPPAKEEKAAEPKATAPATPPVVNEGGPTGPVNGANGAPENDNEEEEEDGDERAAEG